MPDALSLHCPNCGAAADPDATRCPYCRARLATVSCPACFARIFDGAAFCPGCGARRARTDRGATGAACPSCKAPLASIEVGATPLLECASCDGVWIDAAAFEALCASRETQAAVLHTFDRRATIPADGRVRYRPCLRCGKMMNRVNFGRISGTVVDVCRGHGTFLDAGELHAIAAFITSGGLERARARELENLREERRRLEQQQASAARMSPEAREGPLATRSWSAGDLLDLIESIRRT